MFTWFRRTPPAPAVPRPRKGSSPWRRAVLSATDVELPRGRGDKVTHCVQLRSGAVTVLLHHAELVELLAGQLALVESLDGAAFLCDARGIKLAAESGSPADAGAWTRTVPADALALIDGGVLLPPIALLSGPEAASFGAWVRALPA